tara:strand:+ start:399 stop:503 length:105 start_codon:yes stop_codon:yes gene_type:complete
MDDRNSIRQHQTGSDRIRQDRKRRMKKEDEKEED